MSTDDTNSKFEARVQQAIDRSLSLTGLQESDLRPSYCVILYTTWTGKFESPTTASLSQAVAWRSMFVNALQKDWPDFRSVWVSVLQQDRPGRSHPITLHAAEARVDAARVRHERR